MSQINDGLFFSHSCGKNNGKPAARPKNLHMQVGRFSPRGGAAKKRKG
jgi:hypothetical protein